MAVEGGAPVSLSAINASLPDIVQLGGIYTPPDLRGRGYAKAAVAANALPFLEAEAKARGKKVWHKYHPLRARRGIRLPSN